MALQKRAVAASRRPWYEDHFKGDYFQFWLGGETTPRISEERTALEVNFTQAVLEVKPGATILDLCCGHGRHAIPLAKQGYCVVGQDLSSLHLRIARQRAAAAQVPLEWVRADMRKIPRRFDGQFDAVINMFISFGYLESDREDQRVLDGVFRALKPGGRFLIDFLNREFALRCLEEEGRVEVNGATLIFRQRFDFCTGRTSEERVAIETDGTMHTSEVSIRYYSPDDLISMMGQSGLRFVRAWGDFDGSELSGGSPRAILLAEKPVAP